MISRKVSVYGTKFPNNDGSLRQEIISGMNASSIVILRREPENPYDRNAVAVDTLGGQIGYLSKENAAEVAPIMDSGKKVHATLVSINGSSGINYVDIFLREESN